MLQKSITWPVVIQKCVRIFNYVWENCQKIDNTWSSPHIYTDWYIKVRTLVLLYILLHFLLYGIYWLTFVEKVRLHDCQWLLQLWKIINLTYNYSLTSSLPQFLSSFPPSLRKLYLLIRYKSFWNWHTPFIPQLYLFQKIKKYLRIHTFHFVY